MDLAEVVKAGLGLAKEPPVYHQHLPCICHVPCAEVPGRALALAYTTAYCPCAPGVRHIYIYMYIHTYIYVYMCTRRYT